MKAANNAPIYASIYADIAEVFRNHGYALAIHGSLARDFDLVAIPWTEQPFAPDVVVSVLEQTFAMRRVGEPARKLHGRLVYSVVFSFGDAFLDLSFMPIVGEAQ